MGDGSTYSFRYEKNRKLTPQELITYWQDRALQAESERNQLVKTNERLALKLGGAERLIVSYAIRIEEAHRLIQTYADIFNFKAFTFKIPNAPEPESSAPDNEWRDTPSKTPLRSQE